MNEEQLRASLETIQGQLAEILAGVQRLEGKKKARAEAKRAQGKTRELTPDEVGQYTSLFASLYDRWLSGDETGVQSELEAMDVEQLRAIGDANNLNVKSRTPKAKCIFLIGARFREKKQLTAGLTGGSSLRPSPPATSEQTSPARPDESKPQ